MSRYVIGRDNFACTVFVPYDCKNNCAFCTSKNGYRCHRPDEDKVIEAVRSIVRMDKIHEFVITGGEPTANIKCLEKILEIILKGKNNRVFINTTLPKKNLFEFYKLCSSLSVSGVNVSRHGRTYSDDCAMFDDIVEDWIVANCPVPTRVNVVINQEDPAFDLGFLDDVIERWNKHNVRIAFREDYRYMTPENLHSMNDPIIGYLLCNHEMEGRSFCDVCDTTEFEGNIILHRGLEKSSLKVGGRTIINDIIVFQDGFIGYDWDRKSIDDIGYVIKKPIPTPCPRPTAPVSSPVSSSHYSCGGGFRCG